MQQESRSTLHHGCLRAAIVALLMAVSGLVGPLAAALPSLHNRNLRKRNHRTTRACGTLKRNTCMRTRMCRWKPTKGCFARCAVGADGLSDATCGPGRFCKLATGVCGALKKEEEVEEDEEEEAEEEEEEKKENEAEEEEEEKKEVTLGSGQCRFVRKRCGKQGKPVCGCNKLTYRNPCMAQAAGMSVAHPGACATKPTRPPKPEVDYCTNDSTCLSGKCDQSKGLCFGGVFTEKLMLAFRDAGKEVQDCNNRLDSIVESTNKIRGVIETAHEIAEIFSKVFATIEQILNLIRPVINYLPMIPAVGSVIRMVLNVLNKVNPPLLKASNVVKNVIAMMDQVTEKFEDLFGTAADVTGPTALFLTHAFDVLDVVHMCSMEYHAFVLIENASKENWPVSQPILEGLEVSGNECDWRLEPLDDSLDAIVKVTELLDPLKLITEALKLILDFISEWIKKLTDAISESNAAKCILGVAATPALVSSLVMCPVDEATNAAIKPALDKLITATNIIISDVQTDLVDAIKTIVPDEVLTIPDVTQMLPLEAFDWIINGICHGGPEISYFKDIKAELAILGLPYAINFREAALSTVEMISLDKVTYTTESACKEAIEAFKHINLPGCEELMEEIIELAEELVEDFGKDVERSYGDTVKAAEEVIQGAATWADQAADEAAEAAAWVADEAAAWVADEVAAWVVDEADEVADHVGGWADEAVNAGTGWVPW